MNTETMTSRERVVRTLNHQPADRAPLDLGMHPSTGISAFAYHHLRRHLGLDTRAIRVPDVVQSPCSTPLTPAASHDRHGGHLPDGEAGSRNSSGQASRGIWSLRTPSGPIMAVRP